MGTSPAQPTWNKLNIRPRRASSARNCSSVLIVVIAAK
jgi:hypothetical protein